MAFSIKPHSKEGYYVAHGSDILEVHLPFDAFVWDSQLGYWKHPKGSDKVELFKYYALPNNMRGAIDRAPHCSRTRPDEPRQDSWK